MSKQVVYLDICKSAAYFFTELLLWVTITTYVDIIIDHVTWL